MKIIVISSLLILLLFSSAFLLTFLTPVKGQESIMTINCSSENAKLTKIGTSLEEDREEMRENYKLNGDSALNTMKSLPEEIANIIKKI